MELHSSFLAWLGVVFLHSYIDAGELREYCFPQIFNASCGNGEVMFMEAARYGRMKKGRCLMSDLHIGCYADVLRQVDARCSGRPACTINIPDTKLHMLQSCPKDVFAYLEASYDCIKVENVTSPASCARRQGFPVTAARSYLSSTVTQQHGYGSPLCPWLIQLPEGQRINITLYDFGVAGRYTQGGNMCHVYAKVKEQGLASDITICGSTQRERGVYVSETNSVEVHIMSYKKESDPSHFLLYYEAIGCVNPAVPPGAWLKRTGNKAMIACNHTSQTWHIVCRGNQWVGQVDNCTIPFDLLGEQDTLTENRSQFPYGLLVAIIAGVILGIFIGVALLGVVMFCHRKRRKDYQNADTDTYIPHGHNEQQNPFLQKHGNEGNYGYTHVCTIRGGGGPKPPCSCKGLQLVGTLSRSQEGILYEKPQGGGGMRACHLHVSQQHANNPPMPPVVPSYYDDYDGTNGLDIVKMTDQGVEGSTGGGGGGGVGGGGNMQGVEFSGNNYIDSPNNE